MPIHATKDLRVKLRSGWFSSEKSGFLALECTDMPSEKTIEPELFMPRHVGLMSDIMRQDNHMCLWVVECPTVEACEALQRKMPDADILNCSAAGYFHPTAESIASFWGVFAESFNKEPWNNETGWMLCGVSAKLPVPRKRLMRLAVWDRSHLLEHTENVESMFGQMGCFGFIAVRPHARLLDRLNGEFPDVDTLPWFSTRCGSGNNS